MGGECSIVGEIHCQNEGYNCEGLERCYTCSGWGDMHETYYTKCYVSSKLLFLTIFLPLMIFFSTIGVLFLTRSRIKQAANINQCCQSMDSRQWSMVVLYVCFELAVLLDIYFWVDLGVGPKEKRFGNFILGIVFVIVASIFSCCYCCKFVCCQGERKEQFYGTGSS